MQKKYTGSCHCGEVEFTVKTDMSTALRCTCSLCKRKGTIMLAGSEGEFELVKGSEFLTKYQFGALAAEHFFCSKCGIYTHHKPRSNPNIFRVNVGCLEGVDPLAIEVGIHDGAKV